MIANLERLDEEIAGGIVKMNQIIAYASGPDLGVGSAGAGQHLQAVQRVANTFKQFNAWVIERFRDQTSIYSCYADLFL